MFYSCTMALRLSMLVLPPRFWKKVLKTEACWLWTGAINPKGYGVFRAPLGHTTMAHRLSYQSLVGPIPHGATLDHLCRRTGCVRPEHLEPVSNAENHARARGRYCRSGRHEMTGANVARTSYGSRRCRACHMEAVKRWWEEHPGYRGR